MGSPSGEGRRLVLCFDGTGNRYKGNESDTNVVKIYEMLDRHDKRQYHYYQPGIGTFRTGTHGSGLTWFGRMRASLSQLIDQAVGRTFEYHVSSGYKFLMRYYEPGDDIYIFGFSRGAYIARFLAEMIEFVGLLSQGNEEMVRFAFATFSKVQNARGKKVKTGLEMENEDFLYKFRRTFCRPNVRVHFLGLFDCVNSVAQFEIPFRRHSYRYIGRSPAKHIRHAVSIHERRLKFKPALFVFEDNQPNTDVKEVWFAGNHCDVGGGFRYEGESKHLLSDIPLAWMMDEIVSLDDTPAGKLAFHWSTVDVTGHVRAGNDMLAKISQLANRPVDGPTVHVPRPHDFLAVNGGESWYKFICWWIIEILPFFTRLELEAGEWHPRYWPPNFGAARDLPPDAELHRSVEAMHKAGMLEEMPKLGGDAAPLLGDPLVVFRILRPWKWGKNN